MPKSVDDFWHMVVQEDSDSIVMVTNTIEKGFNKCEQYWPNDQGQSLSFGGVEITNTLVSEPPYTLYETTAQHDRKLSRKILHYSRSKAWDF